MQSSVGSTSTAARQDPSATPQAERRLHIDLQILVQSCHHLGTDMHWVNRNHKLADALTKLHSAGSRTDLLLLVITRGVFPISYADMSGRKETADLHKVCIGDHDESDEELPASLPLNYFEKKESRRR